MIALIAEYTIRSIALGALIYLALKILRVSDPRLERTAWRIVLVAAVSMPALLKLSSLSPVPASAITVKYVELMTLHGSSPLVVWRWVLLTMIGVVSAVLIIRQLIGVARCWGMRRRAARIATAVDDGLDVRMSSDVSSPATVFSTILVPPDFERWTAEAQRLAIAHERSHVASKDFYVQWLAQLYRSVFWFNPFAWWLAGRLALLNEHVSDDAALAGRDAGASEDRVMYARVLLKLAQRSPVAADLVPMIRSHALRVRIDRILGATGARRASALKTILVVCTLVPILAATAAFRSPADQVVLPKSNPDKPLSHPSYPAASRRLGETGTVVLKLHVLEDGSVADAAIEQSSGHPDLDYSAYYEAFRWRLDPGTIDGSPSRMWGRFAVTFKLSPD